MRRSLWWVKGDNTPALPCWGAWLACRRDRRAQYRATPAPPRTRADRSFTCPPTSFTEADGCARWAHPSDSCALTFRFITRGRQLGLRGCLKTIPNSSFRHDHGSPAALRPEKKCYPCRSRPSDRVARSGCRNNAHKPCPPLSRNSSNPIGISTSGRIGATR